MVSKSVKENLKSMSKIHTKRQAKRKKQGSINDNVGIISNEIEYGQVTEPII